MKLFFLFFIALLFAGVASADECGDWFKNLNIDPQDPDCEMKCAMGDVDMGSFTCPMGCPRHCKQEIKQKKKKKTSDQCDDSKSKKPDCCDFSNKVSQEKDIENQCDLLAKAIDSVVNESSDQKNPVEWSMVQLKQVFVGQDIWTGRNTGPCIIKNLNGATGFQQDLRDEYNQVQHAMGGIWIGYKYGILGCIAAMIDEPSPQDDKLYGRTCYLGANLSEENLKELSGKLRKSIGDESCQLAE